MKLRNWGDSDGLFSKAKICMERKENRKSTRNKVFGWWGERENLYPFDAVISHCAHLVCTSASIELSTRGDLEMQIGDIRETCFSDASIKSLWYIEVT